MDPLRLAIAIVPLAAYLLVIGGVNLRRRPLVVSGASDAAALAAALSGLVAVGPLELFIPLAAAARFGAYVWIFLIVFYWLCASLAVLAMRPRLVVYNATLDTFRPLLATVVSQLDARARWAGRSVVLPSLGIELHLETADLLRNVSLVATGSEQNLASWRQLEEALRPAAREMAVPIGARGVFLVACAACLLAAAVAQMVRDPQAVALGVEQLLRP
jgi:hypothetical protein